MPKGIITFCYRKIIDANSSKPWEKFVFEDSYAEFKMQSQLFNKDQKYHTFAELIRNVKEAEKLHFLVNAAVIGYVQQLEQTIPDILNNLGRRFLKFSGSQFEIINSHMEDITRHQVAINFYSDPLLWHDTIADHLLVSDAAQADTDLSTHLVKIQPFLSIHSFNNAS